MSTQTVQLVKVECGGCKRAKLSRGDTTEAHADHWKCSGCGQPYRHYTIVPSHEQRLSPCRVSLRLEVRFCPACGGRFATPITP